MNHVTMAIYVKRRQMVARPITNILFTLFAIAPLCACQPNKSSTPPEIIASPAKKVSISWMRCILL